MVFLDVQKLANFMSHLFIFVFISNALGDWPNKTLVQFMPEFLLVFSSRRFMVSCLMFNSSSHFEFIFVHDVRIYSSSLIYIHCPIFPAWLAEETFFPFFILASFVKDYLTIGLWVYFCPISVPLICMSVFVLVPHCLDYYSFVTCFG